MPVRKKAPEDLTAKKALALEVIDRLKKEYPDAGCTLDYDHAWQLLVSVRLAAQCTDARVNIVVEDLFAKYPNVAALAAAETAMPPPRQESPVARAADRYPMPAADEPAAWAPASAAAALPENMTTAANIMVPKNRNTLAARAVL